MAHLKSGPFPTDSYPVPGTYTPPALAGSGTQNDPWLVSDIWELGAVYYKSTGYYKLVDNIDLAGIAWSTAPVPFISGGFDGDNKDDS